MEKISKIVNLSPRMRSINVSRSQPARPGSVEYGRPPGKNSLADQLEELGEKVKPREIADRISASFNPALGSSEALVYKKFSPQAKSVDVLENQSQDPTFQAEIPDLQES